MKKAIFVVGGPSSGKDIIIRKALDDKGLTELALDKFVRAVTNKQELAEIQESKNLIVNGTAENATNIILAKKILEALGYETSMVYVYVTAEVSADRNDERIKSGVKTMSEEVRSKKWHICHFNLQQFAEEFGDNFFLFNNSIDVDSATLVEKKQVKIWLEELEHNIDVYIKKEEESGVLAVDINKLFAEEFDGTNGIGTVSDTAALTKDKGSNKKLIPVNSLLGKKGLRTKSLAPPSSYGNAVIGSTPQGVGIATNI